MRFNFAFLVVVGLVCAVSARVCSAMTVNRLNGGASVTYIDFSIPGGVVPLEIVRTYNSITAINEGTGWSGAFGWGWTSQFETTLTTTPERHVLLRDGGTGNTVLFKPEKDDPRSTAAFFENLKRAYFERKYEKKLSNAELAAERMPENMVNKLKTDPKYRAEMAERYQVKGMPTTGILISSEYGYQTMQFKENRWIREKDGITQVFDNEGRLIKQQDKNGFYFQYKYAPGAKGQLVEISDQNRLASVKFTWRADRIVEIVDNRNQKSRYGYDGLGNLANVTDSNNQSYVYKYENKKSPHLLTRIDYPSESTPKEIVYRALQYDENGLVTLHRDKDGSETAYVYGKGQSDPENNFWTKSAKKVKGAATEELYDEFLVKSRVDGSKYLYKQENRQNGISTTTIFTACCGKPQQVVRNGDVTNYKYFENGLLQEKINSKEEIRFEYDPRWKKVSKVNQNGLVSTYEYDGRGNLVRASNSRKEKVGLKYDKSGRILEMTDTEGKQISFKYNSNGKPVLITEKGVGTIRIDYDTDGRIKKTETVSTDLPGGRKPSEAQSQEVIRRVMKGFQNLLDIIRPAGATLTN